jgi:RNA polymerase sigma factor (sigma-70 family)
VENESQDLVDRARSGDGAAIDSLLQRHLPALRGYVRLRCGAALREHESSSDIVQSACREILEDLEEFRYVGESAFRAWLYQAAERKLKDRVRYWERAKRAAGRQVERVEPSSADDESLLACYASFTTPSQEAIAREQMERIEAAFDELSERERDLIVQKCILGLSNEEIAAGIGESPHYTRTLLSRAQVRLSALVDRIRG